jgi:hypothetical protein
MRLSTAAQFSTPERPQKGRDWCRKLDQRLSKGAALSVMTTGNRAKNTTDSGEDP